MGIRIGTSQFLDEHRPREIRTPVLGLEPGLVPPPVWGDGEPVLCLAACLVLPAPATCLLYRSTQTKCIAAIKCCWRADEQHKRKLVTNDNSFSLIKQMYENQKSGRGNDNTRPSATINDKYY